MSIGGALHSLIALDGSGNPLSGVLTWADGRAVAQGESIKKGNLARRLYEQTGCPPHGMYPLYKIMWFRDEMPDLFRKTARFVSAKEYIFHHLTGEYMVDYGLAAGSGMLNIHNFTWNELSLELAGIKRQHLSELCPPLSIFRRLNPQIAEKMGIPAETTLVLGSSDALNSSLGAGVVHPWQATCMVGTSGALRIITPRPILDRASRSWCYAVDKDRWLVGGAINNGGVVLSWWRDTLSQVFHGRSEKQPLTFEDLTALAQKAGIGAEGLVCLPFFAGERSPNWNLNARAMFFGLSLEHRLEHLTRAILEGIAFRLKSIYDVLNEISGEITEIRTSGGFTQSLFWPQIIADVLNQSLFIPSWTETSNLGAAIWAMLGAGAIHSLEDTASFNSVEHVCKPKEENNQIYEIIYRIFKSLYQAVSPLFVETAALQQKIQRQ
jgi:gluconokinase